MPPSDQFVVDALKRGDVDLLLDQLRRMSQQRGMAEVARHLNMERTNLYRVLRKGGNPKIRTIMSLLELFRIQMTATSLPPHPGETFRPSLASGARRA